MTSIASITTRAPEDQPLSNVQHADAAKPATACHPPVKCQGVLDYKHHMSQTMMLLLREKSIPELSGMPRDVRRKVVELAKEKAKAQGRLRGANVFLWIAAIGFGSVAAYYNQLIENQNSGIFGHVFNIRWWAFVIPTAILLTVIHRVMYLNCLRPSIREVLSSGA